MVDIEKIKSAMLDCCRDDYTGLWLIADVARFFLDGERYVLPDEEMATANVERYPCLLNRDEYVQLDEDRATPEQVRELAMRCVKELLESGKIVAGFPAYPTNECPFNRSELPPAEIVDRINAEWDALGREPNIAEIVWFSTPT